MNENALTDVILLIGIVRRLGTQLASSLCPKPSVPINQMTPAFNIWESPLDAVTFISARVFNGELR
ncbi:hypothetical protein TYRP_000050 [Tyrophagus putrescentiae]|nr:hypothetical protein TYRP_000050 [Tyrophagus putrescentiae]